MALTMIAQWENECILLSVARVLIAQWENECIPLSVTLFTIAQWANECLFALSVARVILVQREIECPLLSVGTVCVELPPFKSVEHNSKSVSTLDRDVTPLTSLLFTGSKLLMMLLPLLISTPLVKL